MAKKTVHKQSKENLLKELREKRRTLQQFRFGSAGSRTRNVKQGETLRKDIARILTQLREREIAENHE